MTADIPEAAPSVEIRIALPVTGAAPAVELHHAAPGDLAAIERDLAALHKAGIKAHRHREHSTALAPLAARHAAALRGYYGVPARELSNGEIIEWALLSAHRGGLPADAGAAVHGPLPRPRRLGEPIAAIAISTTALVLLLLGHVYPAFALAMVGLVGALVSAARRPR